MTGFVALALKNALRQKKRSFTLGANYAIVAFVLVLLFAFSRGAGRNISSSVAKATAGQITVSGQFAKAGRIYNGVVRTPRVLAAVEASLGEGAVALPRYLLGSTVYFKGLSKRVSFVGIDAARDLGFEEQLRFLEGGWGDFAADPNGVVMPKELASYFELKAGDEVVLSTRTRMGAFNTGILKVRGISTTDNYFAKGLILAHFGFLRALDLADADTSSAVLIYLPGARDLPERRARLSEALAARGFEVALPKTDSEAIAAVSAASTRYQADKEGRDRAMLTLSTIDEVLGVAKKALAALDAVGAAIAAVMLFVVAVSIFINLRMVVNERIAEIGTMRAIGMGSGGVAALFVLEGAILALAFSAAGSALALGVASLFRHAIVLPPGDSLGLFLDNGHLVLEPSAGGVAAVVAAITAFAAAFSYFPARRGGRISPVEALAKTF